MELHSIIYRQEPQDARVGHLHVLLAYNRSNCLHHLEREGGARGAGARVLILSFFLGEKIT